MPSRRPSPAAARRASYSLIELIVVLAILVVLGSLMSAAVIRAWASASQKADKKNWSAMRSLGKAAPRQTPFRVLFIGNSYTYVNDLPTLISTMAQNAGNQPAFTFDTSLIGGATLQDHWNGGAALAKIRQGNWDFVVLQEQSMRPIIDEGDFDQYAMLFDAEIQKQGAITLFFMTWARQFWPQSQPALTRAYTNIAQKQHAEVAPVGSAWQLSLTNRPSLVLHADDGSHPNPAGSYLAACVFYAHIYGKTPQGLPPQGGVSASDAAWLQSVAWQAVQTNNQLFQPNWKAQ